MIISFGVCGFSPVTIEECYFRGNIKGSGGSRTTGGFIGGYGIGGSSPLKIKNCSIQGDISGSSMAGGLIGGFGVGTNIQGGSNNDSSVTIENCCIKGSVTGSSGAGGLIAGYGVGSIYSPLKIKNCSIQGNISANSMAGGLISGFGFANSNDASVTIEDCCIKGSCLVSCYNGSEITNEGRKKIWDKYYTAAPEQLRQFVAQYKIVKRV
jgi:hypothetical protein